jgi:general secretion pathway protein C
MTVMFGAGAARAVNDNRVMAARLSAFVIWALVAAGAVFWGYRFWAPPTAMPPNAQFVTDGPALRGDLSRLLGAAPVAAAESPEAAPAESSRFRLVGVLAPRAAGGEAKVPGPDGSGVALIAIDNKPPRAYVVGSPVEGELLLLAVSHRSASIGAAQGPTSFVLELPALAPPATGTLPKAVPGADGPQPSPPGSMVGGAAALPGRPMQSAGAAPGSAPRSPGFQSQRPGVPPPASEADDEEDAPAVPTPRPGAAATR